MTQEEKIKDLEQRIALMDADNSALCADLEHYKKVSSGLKGRNKQLNERIEHLKQLNLEGDSLYEKALAEIDEKNKTISGLQSQVRELSQKIVNLNDTIAGLQTEKENIQLALECERSKPWWKYFF
jgi:chromosome segregation ATPase